ncbi:BamA/TamA family outer membrane protein [Hymenobacter cheonanensis]|uniref:BamA/TamA family outer membrane protein n=1 Tax=Hymenobacter sp. CA2-7 TaxID=3063993 RepID=UPI0027135F15|nr:BamA/TamA family outer membrane protein [Hymenobacter sp. CA2-7]MDO7886242.1 BamA/TamA family outer membrane protein [Hymenobacter sp. CA2-7]
MKPLEQQSNDQPRFGPRTAAAGLLLGLAVLLVAVGCSPLRLLQPKQRLLTKVVVQSEGLTTAQQERLLTLVQQKPNRTIPIPKLAVYQFGHSFYDSARIERKIKSIRQKYADRLASAQGDSARSGKLLARRDKLLARKRTALEKGNAIMRLGEPPVIYDPTLSQRTVEQLTTYLRAQGYFRATATFTDSARSKPTIIARTLRGLGLRKPVRAVPLRDSMGGRLHRLVTVTYQVKEGQGFTLSQLTRSIPDTGVARVVDRAQGATLLHVGEAYNEDLIGQERQRLETLLKNSGYYDFRAQYISLEADTSFEKNQVRLRLLIASPPGGHRAYQLRRVTVITDVTQARALRLAAGDTTRRAGRRPGPAAAADTTNLSGRAAGNGSGRISTANMPAGVTPAAVADSLSARRLRRAGRQAIPRDTVRLDSLVFLSRGPLPISPSILARQVAVRPGQLYNQARTQRTQRQLSNLDMFRFNTVSYRKVAPASPPDAPAADSSQVLTPGTASPARAPSYLDATVTTSPSPRFSETTELGGTYVAGLVGPFANLRLKWRNPFGGAEVLELSGRAGVEGQLTQLGDSNGTTAATYTVQYGATASLLLPQFLTPFHLGNFLANYQPRTRLALSTTYTSSNYYTRSNTELTFDYLWQTSAYQQYIFTPVDLGLVRTRNISDFYQRRLNDLRVNQGSPLYRSFLPIYEPSFSFTSLYNSNDLNQTRSAHFLRIFVELGGLTRGLYRNEKWFEDTGLSVYNFAKLTVDYRRYYKLSPLTYLAWRLNGGVAHALTESIDPSPLPGQPAQLRYILPYDKYLFAGGSNSVRAWSPRRLGTGAYATLLPNGNRDYYTEQPGEVLLEGSLEYRFPVYSFIKGALFTDFGNVWALQNDANRPGADFRLDSFYKQFAVGSGFGIRMDFTFLILRFDIATKVYDPTETAAPWRLQNALRHVDNQTVVNVGLGYPF